MPTPTNKIDYDIDKINNPKQLKKIARNLLNELNILKNVLDSIPCSIYWKDKNGTYLGCNKYQAEMAGFNDASYIIGKTDYDFVWKDYAGELSMIDASVMRSKITADLEETPVIADGSKITMITRKAPLYDIDGKIQGIIGASIDITDLKRKKDGLLRKNEERVLFLERVIELMPGNVYWFDSYGNRLGCNGNMLKSLGLSNIEEYIGKTGLLPQEFEEKLKEINKEIITTDTPRIIEEESISREGDKIFYLTHRTPLHDKQDNVIGVVGISLDITERKKMEKALEKANEKALIEYNQMKNEFILNMEHDIRTPSGGISRMLEILADQEKIPDKKDILICLAKSAKQLYCLLNDIITFNKIVNVSAPILSKPFKLSDLIENIVSLEMPAAKLKELEVISVYQEGLPKIFIGDEFRVGKILLNLISNAIKFTPKGLVKISAKLASEVNTDKVLLAISIKDTGIGFPEEKINFLYEDFTRGDLSRQSKYKGAGLGLKIVKNFINDIGGEILVKSEVDKGTIFTVLLPLKTSLINGSSIEGML